MKFKFWKDNNPLKAKGIEAKETKAIKVLSIKPDGRLECLPYVLLSLDIEAAEKFLGKRFDINVVDRVE